MVLEPGAVEQLAFERCEEALRHRVVVTIPHRAHRRRYAPLAAAFPEGERGVLAALIGVMDDRGRASLSHCHVQRIEHRASSRSERNFPSVRRWSAIAHPATRRLNTLSTTARYSESRRARDAGVVGDPQLVRRRMGLALTTRGTRPLAPAHSGLAPPRASPERTACGSDDAGHQARLCRRPQKRGRSFRR